MATYNILVIDPPYSFSDSLTMSKTKRGAKSVYKNVMTNQELIDLDVASITADDAVLALWVPGSLLPLGQQIMSKWGFRQTQTWIWAKTVQQPLGKLKKNIISLFKKKDSIDLDLILAEIDNFDLNQSLKMNMGRLFRQSHEIALIGVKGSVYSELINKSQKSVILDVARKHSSKTEALQDQLELMFPDGKYLELFARRDRKNWVCIGNENPSTLGENIVDSLKRLASI